MKAITLGFGFHLCWMHARLINILNALLFILIYIKYYTVCKYLYKMEYNTFNSRLYSV